MSPNYYAVYEGRVDRPTIFSSWAQVHPRVTEYDGASHQGFETLEEARKSMLNRVDIAFSEVVKGSSERKSILRTRGKRFYAVAYGRTPGVFENYGEAEKAIKGFKSACHQCFNTRKDAEEFIHQWRVACSEVWQREIRHKLNNGWSLRDMSFNPEVILKMENKGDADKGLVLMMGDLGIER